MYAYEHLSTSQQVHPHLAVSPGVQWPQALEPTIQHTRPHTGTWIHGTGGFYLWREIPWHKILWQIIALLSGIGEEGEQGGLERWQNAIISRLVRVHFLRLLLENNSYCNGRRFR